MIRIERDGGTNILTGFIPISKNIIGLFGINAKEPLSLESPPGNWFDHRNFMSCIQMHICTKCMYMKCVNMTHFISSGPSGPMFSMP